jgi:hypothetical protein
MATTDARPGFRLPWGSDRSENGDQAEASHAEATAGDATPTDHESETAQMIDAASAAPESEVAADPAGTDGGASESAPAPVPPTRKPNKFMADLTKAMQAAAVGARAEALERFGAEATQRIEAIRADTANEAAELRKGADDDIAAVRDWSKSEIARIREETDHRIGERKATLEREIEDHAGSIETRVERVQARVAAFEAEMDAFFERLMVEEDPTRFAALAESLPEAPPLDIDRGSTYASSAPAPAAPATTEVAEAPAVVTESAPDVELIGDTPTATDEVATDQPADDEATATTQATDEAAAEAAAPTETAVPASDESAPADDGGDLFSIADDAPAGEADGLNGLDPRLAALAANPDFAAAEAEAAAFTPEGADSSEEIPTIADDALAARLAGLVPDTDAAASDLTSTRVVVTGLISVASIAGFKRSLSRVAGVASVGVSSGPDGEFIFAVGHGPDVALGDAILALPGFAARITAEGDAGLQVAARDPEAEG